MNNKNNSVVDCDLPSCPTDTCGGETFECTRTCDNGVFGVAGGCPSENEIKTASCPVVSPCSKF